MLSHAESVLYPRLVHCHFAPRRSEDIGETVNRLPQTGASTVSPLIDALEKTA